MKKLLKYPISLDGPQEFRLLRGSIIRKVDYQASERGPMIWVETDTNETISDKRTLQVFGTGHDIPNESFYIGTWQEPPFVWHLYEVF